MALVCITVSGEQETLCGTWQLKLVHRTMNRLLYPAHSETMYQLLENHC